MSIAERDTVRQEQEESFAAAVPSYLPTTKGRYFPAQVTLWPAGMVVTGSARIRSNGWVDVEIARPASMAGLHSYPPHRIGSVEWLPESWEPETGADGCQ